MESTTKNKTKSSKTNGKALPSYADDSFFIKKRETSLKLLQKAAIPASFFVCKK